MTVRVITGSKEEIAKKVASLDGDVREAIVFVEEEATQSNPALAGTAQEMFAEMEAYTVQVGDADSSRAAIYSRMPGE